MIDVCCSRITVVFLLSEKEASMTFKYVDERLKVGE